MVSAFVEGGLHPEAQKLAVLLPLAQGQIAAQ